MQDLADHYKVAQTNFNRREACEAEVKAVTSAFQHGEPVLNVLLDAQIRLAEAEINYYSDIVNYNKSISLVPLPQGLAAGVQWRLPGRRALAPEGLLRRPTPSPGPRRRAVPQLRLHAAQGPQSWADPADRGQPGHVGGSHATAAEPLGQGSDSSRHSRGEVAPGQTAQEHPARRRRRRVARAARGRTAGLAVGPPAGIDRGPDRQGLRPRVAEPQRLGRRAGAIARRGAAGCHGWLVQQCRHLAAVRGPTGRLPGQRRLRRSRPSGGRERPVEELPVRW